MLKTIFFNKFPKLLSVLCFLLDEGKKEKKSLISSIYSYCVEHYILVGSISIVIICGVAYWYFSGDSSSGDYDNMPSPVQNNDFPDPDRNIPLEIEISVSQNNDIVNECVSGSESIVDSLSESSLSSSEELSNILSTVENLPKLAELYPNVFTILAPYFNDLSDIVNTESSFIPQDASLFPIWVPLHYIETGLVFISESGEVNYRCFEVALHCLKIKYILYKYLLETGNFDSSLYGNSFQVTLNNLSVNIPLNENFDWGSVMDVLFMLNQTAGVGVLF